MRTIDADKLKEHIDKLPALPDGNFAGTHRNLKALINMQSTVPAIPIPEGATNGDIIKAIFPDLVDEIGLFRSHMELTTDRHEFYFNDVTSEESRMAVDEKWWDEPYERKDTE